MLLACKRTWQESDMASCLKQIVMVYIYTHTQSHHVIKQRIAWGFPTFYFLLCLFLQKPVCSNTEA